MVDKTNNISRREFLWLAAAGAASGVAGCLQKRQSTPVPKRLSPSDSELKIIQDLEKIVLRNKRITNYPYTTGEDMVYCSKNIAEITTANKPELVLPSQHKTLEAELKEKSPEEEAFFVQYNPFKKGKTNGDWRDYQMQWKLRPKFNTDWAKKTKDTHIQYVAINTPSGKITFKYKPGKESTEILLSSQDYEFSYQTKGNSTTRVVKYQNQVISNSKINPQEMDKYVKLAETIRTCHLPMSPYPVGEVNPRKILRPGHIGK